MTSTEMLLTSNDSLRLVCVGDSSSLVWYHQQRRINVSPTCVLCSLLEVFVRCLTLNRNELTVFVRQRLGPSAVLSDWVVVLGTLYLYLLVVYLPRRLLYLCSTC